MAKYLFINGSRHGQIHDEEYSASRRQLIVWGRPTIGSTGPNGHVQQEGTKNEHYQLEMLTAPDGNLYLIGWCERFSISDLQPLIDLTGHKPVE